MTREQKAAVMRKTDCDLNRAKDCVARASEILMEAGMTKDADKLMQIVYRIEALQNWY